MLFSTLSGSTPWLMVRLPCGSMSTQRTRWPDSLKATARLRAVVVLATPPFWLAKAITLAGPLFLGLSGCLALPVAFVALGESLDAFFESLARPPVSFFSGFGATRSSARMRPASSTV